MMSVISALAMGAAGAVVSLGCGLGPPAGAEGAPGSKGLVVHEWGTFTSFSGSDGELMDYSVRLGEHLPEWVQARGFGTQWQNSSSGDFLKFGAVALQRMETPVIYFYTDKAIPVSVGVKFPKGLITEVFPPVSSAEPKEIPYNDRHAVPEGGSSVRWENVGLQPPYCCDMLTFLDAGKSHYAAARATDSAIVSFRNGSEAHAEKFLFYRGVADCELGLRAVATGGDGFKITRSDEGALGAVFVIEKIGSGLRFSRKESMKPGEEIRLSSGAGQESDLADQMAGALVKAGLFEREAKAMVETWKALWFGEEGTRVLAIVPQKTIDAVLPLDVSPKPVETKRVFVARLEMLTPEREQWLRGAVARLDAGNQAVTAELGTLGRFVGPAMKRAKQLGAPKN